MKRIAWFLCAFCFFPAITRPHLNSISYSTIAIEESKVRIQFRYTYLCTIELFQIDKNMDQQLSPAELTQGKEMIFYYLKNKFKVLSNGRQLKMILKNIQFKEEENDAFTICDLVFPSSNPLGQVIVFCNVSEEVDPYHRNIAEIEIGDKKGLFIFKKENYFDSANSVLIQEPALNPIQSATSATEPRQPQKP
ncbi:hypothetical protein GF373_13340 [bacterium]|nr:hypothetical protein [bacterium]